MQISLPNLPRQEKVNEGKNYIGYLDEAVKNGKLARYLYESSLERRQWILGHK